MQHLDQYREALIKQQDQGRYWWELRVLCLLAQSLTNPRSCTTEIHFAVRVGTGYARIAVQQHRLTFRRRQDPWIAGGFELAAHVGGTDGEPSAHGKDEALRLIKEFVTKTSHAQPTDARRNRTLPRAG